MKTVVIYNMGDKGVKLYLEEGDLSRFDSVEVNGTETGLEDELSETDFEVELSTKEARLAIADGAVLIKRPFSY